MKMSNYIVLYLCLSMTFVLPLYHHSQLFREATKKQLVYNRAVDNAVEDAIFQLIEKDSLNETILNKDKAVRNFFESLYCNFGIVTNGLEKNRINQYIPFILITDKDGFYLNISKIKRQKDGTKVISKEWTKKYPYSLSQDGFVYEFTLGDELKLYDTKKQLVLQGDYHEFAGKYSNHSILNHPYIFEETRRKCIIDCIKAAMEKGIEKHNKAAHSIGNEYQFFFPIISKEDWYRTIDDISFLTIIQGYPWRESTGYFCQGNYSHYAIGGARTWKAAPYYVSSDTQEGYSYYHREDCSKRTKEELVYWSKKDCAKIGAFPCKYCMP